MNSKKLIEYFKTKLAEIDNLKGRTSSSPEFKDWHASLETAYRRMGESYVKRFSKISFSLRFICGDESKTDYVEACNSGLESAASLLKSTIEELETWGLPNNNIDKNIQPILPPNQKIEINLSQRQTQLVLQSLNLEKYDDATKEKVNELFKELKKKRHNKEKIKNIFKWLADKAVDVLISIVAQSVQTK